MVVGMVTVQAQTPVKFGLKVEGNFSSFVLKDLDKQASTMKIGPNLGGFMNIELHKNFAIQPELSFFYRQSDMKVEGVKDEFQQWGMQIPIYFLGQAYTNSGKFYGGVAPYLGLGFDARYKDADIDLYKKVKNERPMNRWDFGLGALIGYEFNNGIQINAGYQIGLIDQLDALKDEATMLNQAITVGIGFRF